MNDDEEKYEDVIGVLKGLQQVKAHPNFEADLKRRLNQEKYSADKKKGFRSFFIPSRLIPSLGLAAAAVLVFMIVNINSDEADDPFLTEPKVREDIFVFSETDDIQLPEKDLRGGTEEKKEERTAEEFNSNEGSEMMMQSSPDEESLIAEREISPAETTAAGDTDEVESEEFSTQPATGFAIRKSALNFRQINITDAQQKEIDILKQKVQTKTEKADIQ